MNIIINKRMKELNVDRISENDDENDIDNHEVVVYIKSDSCISFNWEYFPNCCGIYILHDIQYSLTGIYTKRYAEIMTYVMKKVCSDAASCCMCTLSVDFAVECMKEQGWKVINKFHNNNSGNEVSILTLKV
jgi:hypothetical protein